MCKTTFETCLEIGPSQINSENVPHNGIIDLNLLTEAPEYL